MNDAATHTLVTDSADLLLRALPVEKGGIRSRRILKAPGVRLTRLTLDAGQTLREHVATAPILIQSLAGDAVVQVAGERVELAAGAIIHIDAHVRHAVEALTETHLLLTLLHGQEPREVQQEAAQGKAGPTPRYRSRSAAPRMQKRRPSIVLASSGADSVAIDAVVRRHAEIAGGLATHSARVLDAAVSVDDQALERARAELVAWCRDELAPLLAAESEVLYPAARDTTDGSALVGILETEAARIRSIVAELAAQSDTTEVAATTVSLRVRVGHHLSTQIERLLPALAASPRHELAELWARVDESARAGHPRSVQHADADREAPICECGVVETTELLQLDVRTIPHAIRHATVFGALDALGTAGGLILIAPHDPLPLLAQIEERFPQGFRVDYLESGPEDWRLRFVRVAA